MKAFIPVFCGLAASFAANSGASAMTVEEANNLLNGGDGFVQDFKDREARINAHAPIVDPNPDGAPTCFTVEDDNVFQVSFDGPLTIDGSLHYIHETPAALVNGVLQPKKAGTGQKLGYYPHLDEFSAASQGGIIPQADPDHVAPPRYAVGCFADLKDAENVRNALNAQAVHVFKQEIFDAQVEANIFLQAQGPKAP